MEPIAQPGTAHDLSFLSLFLQADPIVKGVMAMLVLASLICWTVIIDKALRIRAIRRDAQSFEKGAEGGSMIEPAGTGAGGRVAAAGYKAWRDQDPSESRAERRERIERAMRQAANREVRRLQPGLPFLATTGSAAPFIGLFGTVWGIMNSFSAIAESHDTSLSVVAPGIAEALFATAIGLVAAIPAVIAYNKFATEIGRLQQAFASGIGFLGDRLARERGTHLRKEAAE
jgi:TolQ protein